MITAVALRHKKTLGIVSKDKPYHHHQLIQIMFRNGYSMNPKNWTQGFLTEKGEFVTRQQAKKLVKKHKIKHKNTHPSKLFSENLW